MSKMAALPENSDTFLALALHMLISHLHLPQVAVNFSCIFWCLIYIHWFFLPLNHRHVHWRV